jgi:hypothetical protein
MSPARTCLLVGAALLILFLAVHRIRRRRRTRRDPLSAVFPPLELRRLDAHLDRVGVRELERLTHDIVRYVDGKAGHVVVISDLPHGRIVLELSDGRLMTLNGVTRATRGLLQDRAVNDKLRPSRVDRDDRTCRLVLRAESGYEMNVSTRMVSLTH